MTASPFELLELPDGRWYVAKPVAGMTSSLVAGSFAALAPSPAPSSDPVGCYATRDEAELAIQRQTALPSDPFAAWLWLD